MSPRLRSTVRRARRGLGPAVGEVRSHSSLIWDVVLGFLALVLFVVSWATVTRTHQVDYAGALLVAAATVLPLALARRAPIIGWVLALFVGVLFWVSVDPRPGSDLAWTVPQLIVLDVLMVAVALRERLLVVAPALAGSIIVTVTVMPLDARGGLALGITFATVIALLVRWLVLSRVQLAHEQEVSDLERARRAVLEERSRIARDLHDVVAHRMSMVVVQAQSAPARLGDLPGPVAEEFLSISEQARAALNEVRGMLGVLRSETTTAAGSPHKGLQDVEELLQQTRDAGVDLGWDLQGDPTEVGEAVGLVVYRILQEALANASRHAPGSQVRVRVECVDDQVLVDVRNGHGPDDGAPTHERPSGHGTGIVGMVDRAHSVGGTLEASRVDDEFVVRAVLPATASALVD